MRRVKAREFDEAFDRGKHIASYLNKSKIRRVNEELRRVNVDFPAWVIAGLDRQARRLGVTRQSLVKMWIAEKLGTGT